MKLRHLLMLTVVSLPLIMPTPATANPALAACQRITDPIRRFYCEGPILTREAQEALCNSYTPRQRVIAAAVGKIAYGYYQKNGQPLPVNQRNLRLIMRTIGANNNEANFVLNRMRAHSNAGAVMGKADQTIYRMNQFLHCLQTRGTGCIP